MSPKLKDGMVQMQVIVPKEIRDALQRIWHQRGMTISQQVRHSLALWVKAQAKDPAAMDARVAAREIRIAKTGHWTGPEAPGGANGAPMDLDNDPEPDRATEPAKWASWAARQGNKAVKDLAAGHWAKPYRSEPD